MTVINRCYSHSLEDIIAYRMTKNMYQTNRMTNRGRTDIHEHFTMFTIQRDSVMDNTDILIGRQTHSQRDRHTYRQTKRRVDRQGRQEIIQTEGQGSGCRQTEIQQMKLRKRVISEKSRLHT